MNRDYPAKPGRRGRRDDRRQNESSPGEPSGRRGPRDERPRYPAFRLFLAVEIPDDAIRELVRWQQEHLAGDRALRLTPESQLHITLAFLGQMGEKERDQAAAQLEEIEGLSAFDVTATGIVGLPKNRAPRVIAAVIEEPTGRLNEIHDRLAAGLVEKDLYQRGKRPYFPHVTIARARGRTCTDLSQINPEPVKFTAVRVTLYNSILKREGALHEGLKSVQLI